ncbi:hypothetical protein VEE15_39300 [Escherichia coli]|nr:hypothetical protein VEE15_39300 [Escherichia coli]
MSLYQNADDCSAANPGKSAECTTAYNNALKEAERTAPKYATREDCVAEFGEGQCQQAPAQAGMAPENQAQAQQSSGSFWMPLMAGYMMGRLMGGGAGFAQQPLFSSKNPASPAYGKYTDATGKNYGAAQPGRTMTVPKTAMAPKPATTTTVTRGGFGESVAKQSTMQRSATGTSVSFNGWLIPMERVSITERPDWREKAHEYGFNFHTMYGEPYWCEDAYYKLTLAQVEKLEEVTAELHQMCLKVVEKVIASDELMTKFRIPKHTWSFVRQSWLTHQPSLYSRLDLAWDGTGEPKLLENNADTPTSLYEAAFFQWIWLEDQLNAGNLPEGSDQFNSLQEKLIDRFVELREQYGFQLLHLTCCRDTVEDRGTIQYLQDCATEAEIATEFLYIDDIGLGEKGQFTDLQDQVISNLFKLYPWEFMLREMFSTKLEDAGVRWLEPAWKSIISNKALLPLLWEMFPNHPNLLPAYFAEDDHPQMEKYVVKPIFSREGANVSIIENGKTIEAAEGPYGEEGMIVQQFHPLPKFGDSYMLIGSWLVNDQPAGIGIREDRALITQDMSRFYPHIFVE